MNSNVLLSPVPIRFTKAQRHRIKVVARRFGLKPSQIIRQAVETKLTDWESGGMIINPIKKDT